MPQISVIVPVYKVEPYLCRCVDSILGQSFTEFELILVDDGSPDNCPYICDKYAQKDARVIVIHQVNGGLSAARNTGIDWVFANSDSQWITFIDSDDWIHPQYLEALLCAVEQKGVLLGVCGIRRADKLAPMEEIVCSSHVKKTDELYLEYTKKIVNVSACGKLYNRKCFETIRYPLGKQWEDLATTYKIILAVPYCAVVDESLYYYFNNPDGIVKCSWSPRRLDEFEAYETQLEYLKKEKEWIDIFESLQETYIKAISYSYFMQRESSMSAEDKRYYGAVLSKKMRKALKDYNGKLKLSENLGIYETAYPRMVGFFWRIKGVLNKFRKQ